MSVLECLLAIATAGAAIGLVIATVNLVRKTDQLVRETRKQRAENKRPSVSLELLPNKDDGQWADLVLANAGRGPAFDIVLTIEGDKKEFERCGVGVLTGKQEPFNFLLPGAFFSATRFHFSNLRQPVVLSERIPSHEPEKKYYSITLCVLGKTRDSSLIFNYNPSLKYCNYDP